MKLCNESDETTILFLCRRVTNVHVCIRTFALAE